MSGRSSEHITNKICQGKREIRQLNAILRSDKVTKETKKLCKVSNLVQPVRLNVKNILLQEAKCLYRPTARV